MCVWVLQSVGRRQPMGFCTSISLIPGEPPTIGSGADLRLLLLLANARKEKVIYFIFNVPIQLISINIWASIIVRNFFRAHFGFRAGIGAGRSTQKIGFVCAIGGLRARDGDVVVGRSTHSCRCNS